MEIKLFDAPAVRSPSRLAGLDGLRGLAAVAVAWFHMTHGGSLLATSTGLYRIPQVLGAFGHHGVTLFFVISGFVIPYSFSRAGQDWRLSTFMLKRFIRLQPPFLAACMLVAALNLASKHMPGYTGSLEGTYLRDSLFQLLTDNLYVSGLMGRSWILVVAWTLAIEVQFYLVAGLTKHWLNVRPFLLLMSVIVASLVLRQSGLIFHWLPIFTLGTLAAVRLPVWCWRDIAIAGFVLLLIAYTFSPTEALFAGCSLTMVVMTVQGWLPRIPLMAWLGSISYSLYLVHVPIGGRVVNLAARFNPSPLQQLIACILGTLTSIAGAWLFWRLIEQPSHQWSRRSSDGRPPVP